VKKERLSKESRELVHDNRDEYDSVNPRDESGSGQSTIVLSQGGVDDQIGIYVSMSK